MRKHIYYSGRVQGVGFRYTTARIAANYKVNGYVRNMMDGRVEVVAQGDDSEVRTFIEDIAGAMSGYIRKTAIQEEPVNNRSGGFSGTQKKAWSASDTTFNIRF